ncbi:hypothetical protein AB833_19730 [Chromatiales bacterium (ex Bugula neritina AB1)]|nr:hypothetical protein AB833_19730 [Chromatiales bacterium (ex Bugula neritina AB1)]
MKRMLVNATQPEELRVAIVDGQKLDNLDIENKTREQKKSNIYKAKITRVEPSLEAAFVDYGAERHGFLPFKEIAKEFLSDAALKDGGRPNVKAGIREGQEILVQIEKEERGNKGAALTTFVSLAGRFLVLMPNNPRAGGVSRRIEGDERSELKAAMNELELQDGMGIIVRTAGVGRTAEELQWDLDYQVKIWEAIQSAGGNEKAPALIYQESNVIVRALRDYFRSDIGEILIDVPEVHNQAHTFMSQYMPHNLRKLKMYTDDVPLFNRYQIEGQIESAYQREVRLPSGGALVIDHTEALISIDINSARATKGADIEETATNTNLEACDEIGRQLRLRDLGGLVVIDFIDMMSPKNQRAVENSLREVAKLDRARVQIGRISRFGLMEMSRQRLRPSLGETSEIVCPRCVGQGTIRTVESLALQLLRLLEEETLKENTGRVLIKMPVPVATYLLNEKREAIREIEERNNARALLVPDMNLDTPHYEIERIRHSENDHEAVQLGSHELIRQTATNYVPAVDKAEIVQTETAAVQTVVPVSPIPAQTNISSGSGSDNSNQKGLLGRIVEFFTGDKEEEEAKPAKPARERNSNNRNRGQKNGQQRRNGRGQRDNQSQNRRSNNKQSKNAESAKPDNRSSQNKDNARDDNRRQKQAETDSSRQPQNSGAPQTGSADSNQTGSANDSRRKSNSNRSGNRNQRNRGRNNTDQRNNEQKAGEKNTEKAAEKDTRNSQQTNGPQRRDNRNDSQRRKSAESSTDVALESVSDTETPQAQTTKAQTTQAAVQQAEANTAASSTNDGKTNQSRSERQTSRQAGNSRRGRSAGSKHENKPDSQNRDQAQSPTDANTTTAVADKSTDRKISDQPAAPQFGAEAPPQASEQPGKSAQAVSAGNPVSAESSRVESGKPEVASEQTGGATNPAPERTVENTPAQATPVAASSATSGQSSTEPSTQGEKATTTDATSSTGTKTTAAAPSRDKENSRNSRNNNGNRGPRGRYSRRRRKPAGDNVTKGTGSGQVETAPAAASPVPDTTATSDRNNVQAADKPGNRSTNTGQETGSNAPESSTDNPARNPENSAQSAQTQSKRPARKPQRAQKTQQGSEKQRSDTVVNPKTETAPSPAADAASSQSSAPTHVRVSDNADTAPASKPKAPVAESAAAKSQGAVLKQVETVANSNLASESKAKVSAMQPSQLKSSVRSLATGPSTNSASTGSAQPSESAKLQKVETKPSPDNQPS